MQRIRIIIFLYTFLILYPITGHTQETDYFLGPRVYNFIDYEKNVFQFPAGDTAFRKLLFRFDSLIAFGKGKIHILHIGGSHIQADIYTHVMRTRLQSMSPDMNGGRGLIFPYRIAQTNNPSNYKVSYTGNWSYSKNTQQNGSCKLGLTGMAVITYDTISTINIKLNTSDSTQYSFNQINVYHEPTGYMLKVISADTVIVAQYDVHNGYSQFNLDESESELHLEIIKDTSTYNSNFALLGIELISDMPGVVYNSVGVNGAMLSSYLRCELYQKHLEAINPDLITISIGTNDGYTRKFDDQKYQSEYRELLNRTIEAAPQAVLLLTVPNDNLLYRRYTNPNTEKIKNIIQSLAKEYCCGVWDFYTVMGGLNSAQIWYSQNLMRYDRVHFNRKGYELQGDLFFSAFLKEWESQLNNFINND